MTKVLEDAIDISDAIFKFSFVRHLLDLALNNGNIQVRRNSALPTATQHLVNCEVRVIASQEQAIAIAQRTEIEKSVAGRLIVEIETEGIVYNVPGRPQATL